MDYKTSLMRLKDKMEYRLQCQYRWLHEIKIEYMFDKPNEFQVGVYMYGYGVGGDTDMKDESIVSFVISKAYDFVVNDGTHMANMFNDIIKENNEIWQDVKTKFKGTYDLAVYESKYGEIKLRTAP